MNPLSRLVGRIKNWMLGFIEAHGFWGILLLAAYPNAAFDLCGMCCGHFLMPFWEFFGATLIGKGGIKVGAEGRRGRGCRAGAEGIVLRVSSRWLRRCRAVLQGVGARDAAPHPACSPG